jgi:hypothetical protein
MTRRFLICVLGLAVFAVSAVAQGKPNFSGDWKLNVSKSDFGPMPPPSSSTAKVAHAEPEMKVQVKQVGDQGEMEFDATYSTDGKETANTFGPMQAKSTAAWEGEVLVVTTKFEANGMDIKLVQKWSLADEGKTMKQATRITSPQGEFDMVSVYDKSGS